VDGRDRMAIVADHGPGQPDDLIAVARYGVAGNDPVPDVALVVDDAWQGQGLGSILLDEILEAGEARGFVTFHADVLTENRRMLRLLARHAAIVERSADYGVVTLRFRRRADWRVASSPADAVSGRRSA
jgi:GNAT superfamily N-acetyltransferase